MTFFHIDILFILSLNSHYDLLDLVKLLDLII